MRVRSIIGIAATLAWVVSGLVIPASAEEAPQVSDFSVTAVSDTQRPAATEKGYFIYEVVPGGTSAGSLLVKNKSDKPLDVQLAVVPANTAKNGGSAFGTPDSGSKGPASWVKLDRAAVSLEPGGSGTVGFSVRVPATVRPGQYLAGIAAYKPKAEVSKQVSNGNDQATAILDVQMRYVVAVQVDVPGAWRADLSIPEVGLVEQPSGVFLGVHIKNTGDTLLRPSGKVRVQDHAGKTVLEQPIKMGTFVTGTEVQYPVPWPSVAQPGSYNVRVELGYGDGKTATYDGEMTVEAPKETSAPQSQAKPQRVEAPAAQDNMGANMLPPQAAGPEVMLVAIEPWMVYGLGFFLLVIAALQVLNLVASRRHSKAD